MSAGLDLTKQATRLQAREDELHAGPSVALAALRMLRALPDAWRFAHTCMRRSRASDEGAALPIADQRTFRPIRRGEPRKVARSSRAESPR
jgi:hypothetical protein